ncbi:MAG: hypothetical protein MZW92_02015, partial [Comamonadaceae bacterium]|nr:hypothetical protein [Comamonadaceae bacterium]
MTEITPRWEWRSFGRRFGEAEARLAQLTPSGVQESDEIYLLSGAGDEREGPRCADGHQGAAGGQRRWPRAVDAGHEGRLSASGRRGGEGARGARAAGARRPCRASYTLDEFIGQFAAPGGASPRGARSTSGARATRSAAAWPNSPRWWRTASPPARSRSSRRMRPAVMRAVRELGLGGYTNTSYPRGLAALIDDEPERYAVIDAGTNSIKFHIGERDVERHVANRRRPRGDDPPRRGARAAGRDHRRRAGANGRGDRGHGRRGEAARRAGDRRRGHGRPADRIERQRSRRRHPGAHRRSDRGDLGRRGGPAGLRGRQGRSRIEPGLARRLRHRRRQFAVHLRARRQSWTSASASTSAPCATPSASGSTAPCRPRCCARPWRRLRPTSRASTGARFPTRWSAMGGAVTNITAVMHRPRHLRPGGRAGQRPRPRRDRSPDRALPVARCRRPPRHRRPAAEAGGSHPRRCVHRPHGHGEAGQAELHRERPRPAPRRAGRAFR